MKFLDIEDMRVVTNDKHIAEQIKSDSTLSARECLLNRKVENVVMNGPEVGNLEKEQQGKRRQGEERRDGWSQKW